MIFDALRAHGIKVVLDDLGAGVSWLSYLKSFPINYMKIDGQFTRDLLHKPELRAKLGASEPAIGAVAEAPPPIVPYSFTRPG